MSCNINYGNLPPRLVQIGLICGWGYTPRPDTDKLAKVPRNLRTGQPVNPTDPNDFFQLSIAVNSNYDYRKYGFDGLGLGIFGNIGAIDIDHIIDDDGEIAPMGKDIIKTMDSYTEISPSGHGIRILFLATNFQYDKARYYINNQKIGLEVYVAGCTSKYVSITGNAIHLSDLAERGDRLQIVLDKYMQRPVQNSVPVQAPAPTVRVEDDNLIGIICKSKNGEKFKALMSGDTSEYGGDDSSADLALCNILAFYTGKNPEQMDRIFRRSKLMRAKWDSARGDSTYGKDTIAKAIAGTQQVYTPQNMPPVSDPVAAAATISATAPVMVSAPKADEYQKPTSAPELDQKSFPALRYLVERLLSVGTCILAAPSKLGKSWLVLYMGLCIAAGIPWMGFATMQCGVLYCALEDSMARLQDRMRKVLNGIKPPDEFYFLTELPTLDNGLFNALDHYLSQYPHIKLIIIDTLQKVRGKQSAHSSLYAYDYGDMGAFQKYAISRGVAVLFVHHTRKMQDPDDVFNNVSGSTGIMGAIDTTWLISKKRNAEIAKFDIVGREIAKKSFAIKFNSDNFHWELCGTDDEMAVEAARAAYHSSPIVRAIKKLVYDSPDNKWSGSASELISQAKASGIDIESTPQGVGKFLKQNDELLEELDQIVHTTTKVNGTGGYKHHFKYVTDDVDPDDSDGVDPDEAADEDDEEPSYPKDCRFLSEDETKDLMEGFTMNKVLFSSAKDNWATPQVFFNELNREFDFTLDPCADQFNHKCAFYYTKEQDGLSKDWGGERVFCNPPYGRDIGKWVQKAYEESQKENTVVVMLIPARTDTRYFHDYIYGKAEIRFIRGRLKFGDSKNAAPFPSMVVIFGKNTNNVDPVDSAGIDPNEAADDDLDELLPFDDSYASAISHELINSAEIEL